MDPRIVNFMLINGVVVLVLVGYLYLSRSRRLPSRLKLRENERSNKLDHQKMSAEDYQDFKNSPEHENRQERVLNVIFQFNGHDFDAYEVLGIAAGSSLDAVENAYGELLKNSPEEAREFLQIAFNAIKRKLTRP